MIIPVIIPPEEKPPNMVGCAGSEQNEFGIWVCYDHKQMQERMEILKQEKFIRDQNTLPETLFIIFAVIVGLLSLWFYIQDAIWWYKFRKREKTP